MADNGFEHMYGNRQASRKGTGRPCPRCKQGIYTTYEGLLLCPHCGYMELNGARLRGREGGWCEGRAGR